MTTRRLDGKVYSKCSCASDSDDIATDAGLRCQKFKRRILGGLPSLFLFVSLQINCEGIDSSGDQLLSYILPTLACTVALMKQQYARSWLFCGEIGSFDHRPVRGFKVDSTRRISASVLENDNGGQQKKDLFSSH